MTVANTITLLSMAILFVVGWRTIHVMRQEKDAKRGSEPGTGHHIVEVNYHSGGAGGGHDGRFTVPRDPQEYARLFVPKEKD